MIVYNYDADLEVSDTCIRSSLLSWVELGSILVYSAFVFDCEVALHLEEEEDAEIF